MKRILTMAAVTMMTVTGGAHAASLDYDLFDHADGANTPPQQYGLRVDDLNQHYSATGGALVLSTDNVANTAVISGTMAPNLNGTATGGGLNLLGSLVNVVYTMTGVVFDSNGGFTATGGAGSLWDTAGTFQYDFSGKQNSAGYAALFKFDGHRLSGDNSSPVFRNWIMDASGCGTFLSASASASTTCLSDGSTSGTNDFLMTSSTGTNNVSPVPLPAAAWMLLAGFGGLFGMKRFGRHSA